MIPYLVIRNPLHSGGQLLAATLSAWFLGGLAIPLAQPIAQTSQVALQSTPLGRLAVLLPIAALCWTLREPLGEVSETAGRNLRLILSWHVLAIAILTALLALGLSFAEGPVRAHLFVAGIFLGLALISTALWGARWGWVLPSLALFVEIFPASFLPDPLWAWAWFEHGLARQVLYSLGGISVGWVLLLWRPGRPLLGSDSAQARLHQASEN